MLETTPSMPFQHISHHVTSFLYEPRAMDSERWLNTHTKMVYHASHNNFPTGISDHSMCAGFGWYSASHHTDHALRSQLQTGNKWWRQLRCQQYSTNTLLVFIYLLLDLFLPCLAMAQFSSLYLTSPCSSCCLGTCVTSTTITLIGFPHYHQALLSFFHILLFSLTKPNKKKPSELPYAAHIYPINWVCHCSWGRLKCNL